MTRQVINTGAAPNDGTGDPARTAFTKANENFAELYNFVETKGQANGVAALDSRSESVYTTVKGESNTKPAIIATAGNPGSGTRVTLNLAVVVPQISGTGSEPSAYAIFYPTSPAPSNGMYSFRFRGYAQATASSIEFVVSFFYEPERSLFTAYNLIHFGKNRPRVFLGVDSANNPVVAVAVGGIAWRHVVLESALISHGAASDNFIRSFVGGTAADLSGLSGSIELVDEGPALNAVKRSGDTMTGSLTVPGGSSAAPGLVVGAGNSGLSSGGAELTAVVAGVARARLTGSENRFAGNIGFASSVDVANDTYLSRSAAGALAVTAPNGTTFSGPVTINGSFQQNDGADPLFTRHSDNAGLLTSVVLRRGRGTLASPLPLLSGDRIAGLFYSAYSGSTYENFFSMEARASANWSSGVCPSRLLFQKSGETGGRANVLSFEPNNTIIGYTDAQFQKSLSVSGVTFLGQFTQATLPTATGSAGAMAICSNAAGGASACYCDGTDWISLKTGLPVGLAAYQVDTNSTTGVIRTVSRYANGDQICTIRVPFARSAMTSLTTEPTDGSPYTWLSDFVTLESIQAAFAGSWSDVVTAQVSSPSVTGCSASVHNQFGGDAAPNGIVTILAKGRWKT